MYMYTHWHCNYIAVFSLLFLLKLKKIYKYLFCLFFCPFIYLLMFVRTDARFMEDAGVGSGGGGGGGGGVNRV